MRLQAALLHLCILASIAACAAGPAVRAPFTQQRELESLEQVAAYPNADLSVVMITLQQFQANHREAEGYEYFGRLAREQPERRALFGALQGVMQASLAKDVPLLQRVAWVEDAIHKLDAGAAADPIPGRLTRGLVFAELPARFAKSRQAIEDLEFILAHRDALPLSLDRGVYRALADAYATTGDKARSQEMLARAGVASTDDPRILNDISLSPEAGFRFSEKRFVKEAEGVYVAEGYDFANLSFIVTPKFVVAIDAGTTVRTAAEAVRELRKLTSAPIKYVILTHGHWDHVGGLAAVGEPGSTVIAQAGFPVELARSRAYPPMQYFFGTDPNPLEVHPDHLVSGRESLVDGDLDLELIPVHGGETDDGLFIRDRKHDLLFVGDAFMPYCGSPFVAEGSPRGYLDSIAEVLREHPRRLIHGHPPLTALFTVQAMPGLELAMSALYQRTVEAAHQSRPLAEVLHDAFLPESLRSTPKAALAYLITRDAFVQRVYTQEAGYWRTTAAGTDAEGIDEFTRSEWGAALDLFGGGGDQAYARVIDQLVERGDFQLALRITDIGLVRHPDSASLRERRARVLSDLRTRYGQMDPFRFIVYSQWAGRGLAPVEVRAPPEH